MKITKILLIPLLSLVVLVGCAKKPNPEPPAAPQIEEAPVFVEALPDQQEPILFFDEDQAPETRIYFAFGSYDRPDPETLRKEAAAIKAMPGKVVITGHACPIGDQGYNYSLGLNRALAVLEVMHTLGLGYDKFMVKSAGETELTTTDPKHYHLNRWVGFSKE